jgi:tRNA A37 methylthiotransferase MiaB
LTKRLFNINILTKHYINIHTGCARRCAFCSPEYRGQEVSIGEPISKIVDFIDEHKTNEVVLTGINVCGYNDQNLTIIDLLQAIELCPSVNRIELENIDPGNKITIPLLNLIKGSTKISHYVNLCAHYAEDNILKAMNLNHNFSVLRKIVKIDLDYLFHIIIGFSQETSLSLDICMKNLHYLQTLNTNIKFIFFKYYRFDSLGINQSVDNLETDKRFKTICNEFGCSIVRYRPNFPSYFRGDNTYTNINPYPQVLAI